MFKIMTFVAMFAALGLSAASIPQSTVPASTVAESTVGESTVAIYEAWLAAAATPTAFPSEIVLFTAPVEPAMIQLDAPANLATLIDQATKFRAEGRTVYLAYSPVKKVMEMYELTEVLEALRELAPFCDGFAPAYKRSGAHFGEVNRNLAALFCRAVRAGNPAIQLLGEVYFGELHAGEGGYGTAVFAFPGCSAFLGVNLPRGTRKQVERQLKKAGIAKAMLIDVILRGGQPHKRYPYQLYVDLGNDN